VAERQSRRLCSGDFARRREIAIICETRSTMTPNEFDTPFYREDVAIC